MTSPFSEEGYQEYVRTVKRNQEIKKAAKDIIKEPVELIEQILLKYTQAILEELHDAKKAWPDFQTRVGAEWYSRDNTPPNGYIWASNGVDVWLIHGRGEPIGDHATSVKYWTDAYIPAPPEFIKK